MTTAYCIDKNIKITVAYLSQTSLSLENGFTAFINPSSASPNNPLKEYDSPACLNPLSPPCRHPACRQSPNSDLDLDACLNNGYCRLSSHYFKVLLEYNLDTGASDISPFLCFTSGGDLTAVTQ